MSTAQNIAIYVNNFGQQNPTSQQLAELQGYASALNTSGFTTGILWALHVDASGDFIYNDGPPMIVGGQLQSGLSDLPGLLSTVKQSGGTVNKLLFSIGGWTCESDFVNIGNLITQYGIGSQNPLYANFQALQSALYIDGIDLDLEANSSPPPYGHSYSYYTDTVVQLTQMLNSIGMETTYCPYMDEDFWLNCMAEVYSQNNNQQIVSWWNLQCYAGGSSNDPSSWVQQMKDYSSPTGVSDPAAFIVPGYWCANPGTSCQPETYQGVMCPSGIEDTFSNLMTTDAGINGGFIWNYGDLISCENSGQCSGDPMTVNAYAQAIINGLSTTKTLKAP
ncbi:MAG TPA: hypothetical protein VKA70_06515 [Blastocatellia bacterium]|nr:hypothetical protein [Blastocatellia bacterium]